MHIAKILLFVIPCFSGCVTKFVPPKDGPQATLITSMGKNELMFGGAQTFEAFGDAECKIKLGVPGYFSWTSKENKTVSVSAAGPLFIKARTEGPSAGMMNFCFNTIEFQPREGETYTMTQNMKDKMCHIEIRSTNGSDPEIKRWNAPSACYPFF